MGTISRLMSSEGETMKSQIEGKLGQQVIAAGELRQGRTPSLAAMLTGTALMEVLRPRRSKALPKRFALALTADRVFAFSCLGVSDEDGSNYHVVIRGDEQGSWAREAVSISGLPGEPGKTDGTLDLAGEQIPVSRPNLDGDTETDGLVELLALNSKVAS